MRCCNKVIIDKLSRQAWIIISAMWLLLFILSVCAVNTVWWGISFYDNDSDDASLCAGNEYIAINIDSFGACNVNRPAGSGTNDCIHWSDKGDWKVIDRASGSDTSNLDDVFNVAYGQTIAAFGLSLISTLLAIMVLFRPQYSMTIQFIVFFTSLFCSANLIGAWTSISATDVIKSGTWKPFTDCPNTSSYPFVGYYSALVGSQLAGVLMFMTILPGRCCCLHLVEDPSVTADNNDDTSGGGSDDNNGTNQASGVESGVRMSDGASPCIGYVVHSPVMYSNEPLPQEET
jgi:hypothetical protein